ncbi:hypothetical protein CDD83_823 [Cordyceps sp. RAO-2017]|nr:hypothetical protein CDD83_823 [Cordyceps sp. RAO-2017]
MLALSLEQTSLGLGALLLLLLCHNAHRVYRSPVSKVPGPWLSKWTGIALLYHWLRGRRCQYVHSLHAKYGSVVRLAPNEVGVSDLEAVKSIYTSRETFRKTQWYRDFTTVGNENVFNTTSPDFHRRHRRLLAAPISEANVRAYYDRIESRTRLAVDKMRAEMAARGAADVFKWWYFMATDVIGDLTFGQSFQMLELGKLR